MDELEAQVARYAESVLAQVPAVGLDEVLQRVRPGHRRTPRWLSLAAAVLLLGGLAGVVVTRRSDTTVATTRAAFPLTLDGHRDWTLAVLNGQISPSDDDLAARFSAEFLQAVPPATYRTQLADAIARGPWTVLAEVERRTDALAVQLATGADDQARLTVHLGADGKADASTILNAVPCAGAIDASTPLSQPLRSQLDWVRGLLGSDMQPSDDEVRAHLAPSFITAVPPPMFRSALARVRAIGPLTLRAFEGAPRSNAVEVRMGVDTGEEVRLALGIEAAAPWRITAFTVLTQSPCRLDR